MRIILLLLLIVSIKPLMAEPTEEVTSYRFGKITVKSTDGFGSIFSLLINGEKIFEHEGASISVDKVISIGEKDYVVVTKDSGGIACPAEAMYFIELAQNAHPIISRPFAECSSGGSGAVVDGIPAAIVPIYYPHPEYLTPKELKESQEYEDIYLYRDNKIKRIRSKIAKN